MALSESFSRLAELPFFDLLESLIPDFIIAFAFFTALAYAILGKRFGQQRPAIVMSAAVGFALATGLVWWERQQGLSIKDLGPLAVGFAIILMAMLMFQAIRQTGGTWAGAGIASGASILIASALGMGWAGWSFLPALAMLALIVGVVAFVLHSKGQRTHTHPLPESSIPEVSEVRHDMSDLYEDRHVDERLDHGLSRIRGEARHLADHPQEAPDVMGQLRRILPAEGWLTERMARLRERAYLVRKGHAQKLEETKDFFAKLPASARKKVAADLIAGYQAILGIDQRLERLDAAVAENERRVKTLTTQAQEALARYDYPTLNKLLEDADNLQHHNVKLFRLIERSEQKLAKLVKQLAEEARQVSQG